MYYDDYISRLDGESVNVSLGVFCQEIDINIATLEMYSTSIGSNWIHGWLQDTNKLPISSMLTGWGIGLGTHKAMSNNKIEISINCANGVLVKRTLQYPYVIAQTKADIPTTLLDAGAKWFKDWADTDDFVNPDITLGVDPTNDIISGSAKDNYAKAGKFYLYYRNLPIGTHKVHIKFDLGVVNTESIDFNIVVPPAISSTDQYCMSIADFLRLEGEEDISDKDIIYFLYLNFLNTYKSIAAQPIEHPLFLYPYCQ